MEVRNIALSNISQPERAHRFAIDPEKLQELQESIRVLGLLQPITVRPNGLEHFEVVAGHRRLLACDALGWQEIPCNVIAVKPVEVELARFAENTEREGLSPVEEAHALANALDLSSNDRDQLAHNVRRSRAWVDGRLEVLSYPAPLLEALHMGDVGIGVAREIARVPDEDYATTLLAWAASSGASTSVVRQWRLAFEADAPRAQDALLEAPEVPPDHLLPQPTVRCGRCATSVTITDALNAFLCPPCVELAQLRK